MSTAPLDREKQIELMKNSTSRLTSRVEKWKASDTVSQILRKPHGELSEASEYVRNDERVVSCA